MKYFSLLFLFLISQISWSQVALSDDVLTNIEKRIEYDINPSIAIGIIDKNGPQYYSFGSKTIDGEAIDEHTIYEIGSITKTFTAILLADLVEKGKVSLDDPLSKYLPDDVKAPTYNGVEITLGQLSDHTSSLPRMPDNFNPADRANPYSDYTVENMLEFVSGVELTREIGSEYEYSNLAQGLLGHILAVESGMTYEELVKSVITKPLGMEETKITFDSHMKKNLAVGHDGGTEVSNWDIGSLAGAGGIRSSVHDMLKYMAANLGLSKTKLKKPIEMTHEIRHDKSGRASVGLAWNIIITDDAEYITHGGATGGYRAFSAFNKKEKKGIVLLTNSTASADEIGRYLMGFSDELSTPLRDIAAELRKTIDSDGVEAAVSTYHKIKESGSEEYSFDENNLNSLGYYYMPDNLDAALAIFKINIGEHPDAFNPYDSYAEALMNQSIANYKKSIELNPANENGYTMLAKMGVELDKEDVVVDEDILARHVGNYQLAPTFIIEITHSGNQLFAQATGQQKFEIFPSSDTEYYFKVVDAQIKFTIDANGETESLTLFQGGREMPGPKVE